MNWVLILFGFVIGIAFLAGLHQFTGTAMRRRLMVTLTFLGGLFYLLEFAFPPGFGASLPKLIHFWVPFHGQIHPLMPVDNPARDNVLSPYIELFGSVTLVIGGFAFGLGLLNLATIHGRTLMRLRSGWHNSLAFFLAMILMAATGLLKADSPTAATINKVLFEGLYLPLGASVFAILAFFITTAAYRAFRIRSGEATLMMIAAFIVMMAQVPMGMAMTNWIPTNSWAAPLRIEEISNWLMTVLNMAALRAVGFGIGIGGLAMSLRVWLSLEKGSYFGKEM